MKRVIVSVINDLSTDQRVHKTCKTIHALDFEGSHGMLASIGVWFLGAMLVGLISPGRTFLEPNVATIVIAIPTVMYLHSSQTVFTLPTFLYVVLGCIGVLFSLVGSYVGERIQMGPVSRT